jgi:hypothetical protein
MLSKALNADPSIALRTAQKAYTQATSVKMENTVNQELNDNVKEAIKQGLPPFNTKKLETVIGPVNANMNGIPANGVDFINSYYNTLNGNTAKPVTNNGYIPYQTHNENPKNIDKFLVEEYGNIINASLTGTPYSGSVTAAQLKNLSSGIESKIANDPGYMSGIVNKAQQNVLGFNYMPYDKNDFISRAQDPSSREFALLNQTIANHINDICRNNKQSFNGEFQELSKDLTEKLKKTDAVKETKKNETKKPAATTVKKETKPSSPASGGTAAKSTQKTTTAASAGKAETAAKSTNKTTTATAKSEPAAKESIKPATAAAKEEFMPAGNGNTGKKEERPSIFKEVTEFVKKNIKKKKPSLVLVDTYLGAMVDKAKKIVRTGKTIAAAMVIATNVVAPNLQLPVVGNIANINPLNKIEISVNKDSIKAAAGGISKTAENLQQKLPAKSAARR